MLNYRAWTRTHTHLCVIRKVKFLFYKTYRIIRKLPESIIVNFSKCFKTISARLFDLKSTEEEQEEEQEKKRYFFLIKSISMRQNSKCTRPTHK